MLKLINMPAECVAAIGADPIPATGPTVNNLRASLVDVPPSEEALQRRIQRSSPWLHITIGDLDNPLRQRVSVILSLGKRCQEQVTSFIQAMSHDFIMHPRAP